MRQLLIPGFALAIAAGCAPADVDTVSGTTRAGLSIAIGSQAKGGGGGGNGGNGGGSNIVSQLDQINVSIYAVAAHAAGGGWIELTNEPSVVDILRLQDHAQELGFANIPDGKITQIRLYVANDGVSNVVDKAGVTTGLIVPSGFESGIKLKGPVQLGECEYGQAVSIIDLEKSIHVHEAGGHEEYLMRPTIHKTDFTAQPADICDGGDGGDGPGGDDGVPGGDVPGGDDGVPGGDDGVPGGDDGEVDCPPDTEGCVAGGDGDGAAGGDGAGDGAGGGVGQPGDGDDGAGSGDGSTDPVDGDGAGSGDGSTDPVDGGDGTGTGVGDGSGGTGSTDGEDACTPVLTEVCALNPCTGDCEF